MVVSGFVWEDGTMTVITMSRQIGSGAAEVANRLCDELGLVAVDKRLMLRVATEVGLPDQEIIDYSEEQYKTRGFLERLFGRNPPVAEVST
jgi:cytidylate kinase